MHSVPPGMIGISIYIVRLSFMKHNEFVKGPAEKIYNYENP